MLLFKRKHSSQLGHEQGSSGYGRWLKFERSWVQKLAGHDIFTLICFQNCIVCLKKTKNKRKRGQLLLTIHVRTYLGTTRLNVFDNFSALMSKNIGRLLAPVTSKVHYSHSLACAKMNQLESYLLFAAIAVTTML